jgi:pilus assembly protein Flp/PilA
MRRGPRERPPAVEDCCITDLLKRFVRDDAGATAIEYGLIAAGIAVAIITAVNTVGTNLTTTFNNVASNLTR